MTPDVLLAAAGGLAGWLAHSAAAHRRLQAARHDPVTGLPARDAWTRQGRKLLRGGGRHVVLLIDIDRFKHVNDTYGHAAGDQVLAVTAARIRAWTDRTGGGACGRLGGDEFVIVTRIQAGREEIGALAALLSAPVTLPSGETVPAGASVGAAACTDPAALPAALGAADRAMYEAKRAGAGWCAAGNAAQPAATPARRARHYGPGGPAPAAPASVQPGICHTR